MARRLDAADVRVRCDPAQFAFASTAELPPVDGLIGQERVERAVDFGIGMKQRGYNLFVLGAPATGKTTTIRRVLARAAESEPTPSDWCYVQNFADPYRPTVLELPAGQGRALRAALAGLVEECRLRLPRAFEGEEFERQKSQILEGLGRRQHAEITRLEEAAQARGFVVLRGPGGLAIAPAPKGEALSPEEFGALPEPTREEYEVRGHALREELDGTVRQLRQLEREARDAHEKLVRDVAAAATHHLVQELRERFEGRAGVLRYLDDVEEDLIAHAEEFRQLAEGKPVLPFLPQPGAFLERYGVNVVVDRTEQRGAPVVFERNPTYGNLVGRLEHRFQFGALVTDLTLLKAGALHQANGGYLVLEAKDLLRNMFAWEALKKALKSRSIRLEDPLEELRPGAAGLAPEPIALAVKVVLIGSPIIYYLLHALDEDFSELFKVQVDFDDSLPRTPEFVMLYARFVGSACRDEGLPPFAPDGVAALVDHGSRLVEHQERLTARLGLLLDVVREAGFWAGRAHGGPVTADDVRRAVAEKIRRASLVQERIGRLVTEGTLMVATDGTAVGQVNGIAVLSLGDHAFGRPVRITARSFCAEPGVLDIERESKLGGKLHSKGMLILTGFLAGRYAHDRPLALSASLAFEQQYEEVDGDSASSAELYALLSSISGIPLAQGMAVTGSVNQHGQIQAVGGINEKIEGFFDLCRARGLPGGQGVLIPQANVRHLMLREDVVEAVRDGRFAVHAVSSVDEGMALLTGRPAGERGADGRFPAGSVNGEIERVLQEGVERLKQLRRS